ncbi:MAG: precorrin-2 C(20)-methyltransferase [Propionibacteriaceae bacterium]|nr:precorrin-2 C(20)-methyltransferase [Propionibacteriaceae bacterium]
MTSPPASDAPLTLVGVGVGPGDPELLTLKAARVLAASDAILVPSTEESATGPGRAETIVTAGVPGVAGRIVRVPFVMKDRTGVTANRTSSWAASARAALDAYGAGATTVSFATIGDPSIYSTFSYLVATVLAERPDVRVEVVPGITAMQALAAASRTPLVEGDEVLALIPLKSGVGRLVDVAASADTCVVYKSGRHFAPLKELVTDLGRDAVVGTDVGLPGQRIAAIEDMTEAPYFTTVIVSPERSTLGGRL